MLANHHLLTIQRLRTLKGMTIINPGIIIPIEEGTIRNLRQEVKMISDQITIITIIEIGIAISTIKDIIRNQDTQIEITCLSSSNKRQ